MVNVAFIVGTAGSGKTLLSLALGNYITSQGARLMMINLDPAVKQVPYGADIDIREYVDIDAIEEQYSLGPNGALIAAADLVASYIPQIKEEIDDFEPDAVLIDTPGQLEVFVYRESGPIIASHFRTEQDRGACIFLFDSAIMRKVSGFISVSLLASSTQFRLQLPMIHVLSKADMIAEEELDKMLSWSEDLSSTYEGLEEENGLMRDLSTHLADAIISNQSLYPLVGTSSFTGIGLDNIAGELSRIWTAGEDWKI